MAGASLLTLLDDIASILDDVSVLTKVAAKKTAGVLGDDLALNAQQVAGVHADRELPVVWAVFKGSAVNKAILVPAALAISAFAPWLVTPLLMAGGLFLCYEGVEKLAHAFEHRAASSHGDAAAVHAAATATAPTATATTAAAPTAATAAPADAGTVGHTEKDKIKGAVRTDFILSAEIIAITLGTVATAALPTRIAVLVGIAAIMTVGVYGLVAAIVKLDDLGLHLSQRRGDAAGARLARRLGRGILTAAPYLMKGLSIAGTAAMFLVGGGILTHGVATLHHWIEAATTAAATVPGAGVIFEALTPMLINAAVGIAAGAVVLLLVNGGKRLFGRDRAAQ
ncbi:MAG: DUF808 domain-containing protein [Lautropia sp.]